MALALDVSLRPLADDAPAKVALAQASIVQLLARAVVGGALLAASMLVAVLAAARLLANGNALAEASAGALFGGGFAASIAIGAELFPTTAIALVRGVLDRGVDLGDAALVALASLLGNLAGAVAVAVAADVAGVVQDGSASVYQRGLGALAVDVGAAPAAELLVRSMLAGIVLGGGLWWAARVVGRARLVVLWAIGAVPLALGLRPATEVASVLAFGALSEVAVWGDLWRALAATASGNLLGATLVLASVPAHQPQPAVVAEVGVEPEPALARPAPAERAAPAKTARAKRAAAAKTAPAKRATPAKQAPAKTTPAKTAPAKEAPAKTTPAKTTPAKTTPAKTAPAKTAPAKEAPAKRAPAKRASAKSAAVKQASAKSAPAKRAPAKQASVKTASVKTASATRAAPAKRVRS